MVPGSRGAGPVRECLGSDVIVHTTSVGSEPLVAFDVAGHTFAVPVEVVREVAALPLIDDLPGAPPGVEGVVDVHGVLVPVLDVAAGTGVGTTTPKLDHHLLVADVGPRVLALHVGDRVAVCAAGPELELLALHTLLDEDALAELDRAVVAADAARTSGP